MKLILEINYNTYETQNIGIFVNYFIAIALWKAV